MKSVDLASLILGVCFVVFGLGMLGMGIAAYTGRWKSWVAKGPSSKSTAKNAREMFAMFWFGAFMIGILVLVLAEVVAGVSPDVVRPLFGFVATGAMAIGLMQIFFLPRFLRPLLLPGWYREWEDAGADRRAFTVQDEQSPSQYR